MSNKLFLASQFSIHNFCFLLSVIDKKICPCSVSLVCLFSWLLLNLVRAIWYHRVLIGCVINNQIPGLSYSLATCLPVCLLGAVISLLAPQKKKPSLESTELTGKFGIQTTCVSVTVIYFSDASQVKQTGVNRQQEIKHHDLGHVSSDWATSLFFWSVCCRNVYNSVCVCRTGGVEKNPVYEPVKKRKKYQGCIRLYARLCVYPYVSAGWSLIRAWRRPTPPTSMTDVTEAEKFYSFYFIGFPVSLLYF